MSVMDTTSPGRPSSLSSPRNPVQTTATKEGIAETVEPELNQLPDKNTCNTNTKPDADKREKRRAPMGECKFDGTDYPDWLPINPFKKADEPFEFPFPEIEGDPWAKAAKKVEDYDDAMCAAWTDEIQNILLFAGLFSAVVTAFAIETQSMLQSDPAVASVLLLAHLSTQLGNGSGSDFANTIAAPFQNNSSSTQSLRINVFMYFSLVLSLGTALVGIIALQWIRSYGQTESQSDKDRLALRQSRYQSLMIWKVPQIISALPIILQVSLIIFFAGLIDFLHSLSATVNIIISSLIGAIVLFVLFTTVAPGIAVIRNHQQWQSKNPPSHCPYQSPQAWLLVQFLLVLKRAGNFVLSVLIHCITGGSHKYMVYRVQRKLMEAQNWAQLVQVNLNPTSWSPKPEPIASSLQWIGTTLTDLESFRTLFHCFQTLNDQEMQDTLLAIYDQSHSDSIKSIVPQSRRNNILPLEKKHLFSNALLYWGIGKQYWEHHGIEYHAYELSLRSATYSVEDPSDNRIVMSKLPLWPEFLQTLSNIFPWQEQKLRLDDNMWSFGFLLYFQESESDLRSSPDFDYGEMFWRGIRHLELFMLDHSKLDDRIFDDILGVLDQWLIIFISRNVDDETENARERGCQMVREIVFLANRGISIRHQVSPILQRPNFLSFLDHFAEHPQGQQYWQQYFEHDTTIRTWYRLFVDNFIETRYAALILDSDKQEVERLVEERDRKLPQQIEAAVHPDINDNTDEGDPDADIANSASNLSQPAALDDSPPSATAATTTLPSRPNTIIIAPIYTPLVHAAPSYTAAGVDVELGLPFSSGSQGAFIEDADDVQDHPSPHPPETLLTVVVHSSTNN